MAHERLDSEHIDQRACACIVEARVALEHGDGASVQRLVTETLAAPTMAAEFVDELYDLSVQAAIADGDEQVLARREADLDALKPARTTKLLRASAARLRAELAHRNGDEPAARRAETEAEALLREAGARPRLARALLERARRRDEPEALAEARSIYGELDASTGSIESTTSFRRWRERDGRIALRLVRRADPGRAVLHPLRRADPADLPGLRAEIVVREPSSAWSAARR